MQPKSSKPKSDPAKDLGTLIDLTKTTQTLLTHFQSSLVPTASTASSSASNTEVSTNPLETIKSSARLLKSHTTTLSLLLLTPPLTPSALISKIGDVSSGVLSGMVAAASSSPTQRSDELGAIMRAELRTQVRRVLSAWGDVLTLVSRFAERRAGGADVAKALKEAASESERQDILAATGLVWESCDAVLKLCADGVVGLVVKKAEEYRSTLVDAIDELKEWGEDVEDDEDEDEAAGSGDEDEDGFGEEDAIFGAANKLKSGDKELKELLDTSVKKLKMVAMLYQALTKRRLKTFPKTSPSTSAVNGEASANVEEPKGPIVTLDNLMALLKSIPETVDDLASAFYDLDQAEAKSTLSKCCSEAKSAAMMVEKSWDGKDDEFKAWSMKWINAMDAS